MLTIAIPTYNRCDCLGVLLNDIVHQLPDVPRGSISILVSDNASTDSTACAVEGYVEKCEASGAKLTYRRNETNLGFSPNVDLAVSESPGEYVLIMGDDDGLESGTLKHVCGLLSERMTDFLFLRSVAYDAALEKPLETLSSEDGVTLYEDGLDFIRAGRCYPPALVSGFVVRKAVWQNLPARRFNYSICIHTLAAAILACGGASVTVSHRPCIRYRTGQPFAVWSSDPVYPFRFNLDSLRFCREERRNLGAGYGILYDVAMRQLILNQLQKKLLKMSTNMAEVYSRLEPCLDWGRFYTWVSFAVRFVPALILEPIIGKRVRAAM